MATRPKVMEKYYTPDISEFHVGFEYESNNEPHRRGYDKAIFTEDDIHNDNFMYHFDVLKTRVKCLDRKDCEELGWEVIKEPYRWQWQYKETSRWKFTCDIHTSTDHFPIPHPNSGSISIKDNRDGDDFCVFYGYIRNKSEFRKIMEHLDIIQFHPLKLL